MVADDLAMDVAEAFGLDAPTAFDPIQVGSYETWRLVTDNGSFLVKRLWQKEDPERRAELEGAMGYEVRVAAAGVRTATVVTPRDPLFGSATRVASHGTFRAYEWLDHRPATTSDDLTDWVGATLARLHTIERLGPAFEPAWRWLGVRSPDEWHRWIAADRPWAERARETLAAILDLTDRIRALHYRAEDHVVSHRDFGPWNVLLTANGPVLIDWEAAGPIKASAEVGRVLSAFGNGDPTTMRRIMAAYEACIGEIHCEPRDLFAWELAHHLTNINERIVIALGEEPPEHGGAWMKLETVDADIAALLDELPEVIERFDHLGLEVAATPRRSA